MQSLLQDIRYGARTLFKKPGFTLVAVFTLALGIGANTAIFRVVNGVLLRPLAYQEPERIVTLLHEGRQPVSPANFLDVRSNTGSFERMAAAEAWSGTIAGDERPEVVRGLRMGEGLFSILGMQPAISRAFQPEDYKPGSDRVLVLSHRLWERAFGGDAKIAGRQLIVSGESFTVVGVMPPQFQFPPFWATRAEMWSPLELDSRATRRGGSSLRVFGKLKPGVEREQAQAEADWLSRQLAGEADCEKRLSLQSSRSQWCCSSARVF
jgi:hypothetical protein